MKVVNFLFTKKEGAARHEIARKSKIKTQADDVFKVILDELVEMNWIEKKPVSYGGGMMIYTITEEGKQALIEARNLIHNKHPLSKLDTFDGIE